MNKVMLCIALAAAALAATSGAPSARSDSTPQVLALLAVTGQQQGLNGFHFQREPRAGDQIAETDNLYRWAGNKRGARVGRAEMIFTTKTDMNRNGAVALLVAQAFLPGGSLFVEGYARFGGAEAPSSFPILGGTGAYATARGYLVTRPLGQARTNLEFHLAP